MDLPLFFWPWSARQTWHPHWVWPLGGQPTRLTSPDPVLCPFSSFNFHAHRSLGTCLLSDSSGKIIAAGVLDGGSPGLQTRGLTSCMIFGKSLPPWFGPQSSQL